VTIRVLIADDQQLIRDGYRMILAAEPDMEVIGEAATGHEAIAITRELSPDVVLMDIRMPELDGIEATRRILARDEQPRPRVLILTTFDLDEYVFDALLAGASGFLLKDVPKHQLIAGIRTIGEGDALLAPAITRRLIEEFAARRTPIASTSGIDQLTRRELEVFRLLARGMSNGEIAEQLILGENHPDPDEAGGTRPRPSPAPQVDVDALEEGIERGPVEPAVVVDPPEHDGVQPPRQVIERQVGAPIDPHPAEFDAFGLERLGADRRQEPVEDPASCCAPPSPEGVPEEAERGVLVLFPAPTVLAVDDPRLLRVKREPDLAHPLGDPAQHVLRLAARGAVHDRVVGVALEWAAREVPGHPRMPGRREAPRAARLCKPDWRRFPPAPLSTVRRVFPYTAGSERISAAAFPNLSRSVGAPTRPSDPSGPFGLACRLRRRRGP